MTPKDLAVCLNVSQGQIARILRKSGNCATLIVGRYPLAEWMREMRTAEMYLRHWFKDDQDKEIPVNWKIEQQGVGCWAVTCGTERHWATTAEDAVALKRALEREKQK